MKIIKPSFQIESEINPHKIYENLENIARTCYKSESVGDMGDAAGFIRRLIDRGHEAMIEREYITVRFIHNRGFTHELVRHRIASYAQESTRYCNYSKDKFGNELTFIEPYWFSNQHVVADASNFVHILLEQNWAEQMVRVETLYLKMIIDKLSPQAARGILPNDIKTEIVITANLREWRAIFKLRCDAAAHPDMRRVMIPLHNELKGLLPDIFF